MRSSWSSSVYAAIVLVIIICVWAPPMSAAPLHQQTFVFQPGWNSIYLEVQPDDRDVEQVFSDAACGQMASSIASVWTYDTQFGTVGTPLDPAQGLLNATGWYGHFHSSRPESVISNLFSLSFNRAYLVHNDGPVPVTCNVQGVPLLLPYAWNADSFSLTGLHVDPDNPPSFGAFFGPSSAHAGQPVFRLDNTGVWNPVQPFFEPVRSGEAYWIYTDGPSKYQGPLVVDLNGRMRLDLGATIDLARIGVTNNLDVDTAVRFEDVSATLPLKYYQPVDSTNSAAWLPLPDTFSVPTPANDRGVLTVAPDRSGFSDRVEQILEINNGLGTRFLVAVGANTANSVTPSSLEPPTSSASAGNPVGSTSGIGDLAQNSTMSGSSGIHAAHANSGLWVGTALVTDVGETRCEPVWDNCMYIPDSLDDNPFDDEVCATDIGACTGAPGFCSCSCDRTCAGTVAASADPTPAGGEFPLRLIVHVDGTGNATLLKEVVQLFRAPTMGPDPVTPEFQRVIDPGDFVLITDENLIGSYNGVAMRDGQAVGTRISTTAYDWSVNPGSMGQMEPGGQLQVTLELGANHPTNPYRHKFHPDHDNLDAQFLPLDPALLETPGLMRTITLDLETVFPPSFGLVDEPPGWGSDVVGGTYFETVEGLHRLPLLARGRFMLTRVANQPELNPVP